MLVTMLCETNMKKTLFFRLLGEYKGRKNLNRKTRFECIKIAICCLDMLPLVYQCGNALCVHL